MFCWLTAHRAPSSLTMQPKWTAQLMPYQLSATHTGNHYIFVNLYCNINYSPLATMTVLLSRAENFGCLFCHCCLLFPNFSLVQSNPSPCPRWAVKKTVSHHELSIMVVWHYMVQVHGSTDCTPETRYFINNGVQTAWILWHLLNTHTHSTLWNPM